jgi:hypothetical protein
MQTPQKNTKQKTKKAKRFFNGNKKLDKKIEIYFIQYKSKPYPCLTLILLSTALSAM